MLEFPLFIFGPPSIVRSLMSPIALELQEPCDVAVPIVVKVMQSRQPANKETIVSSRTRNAWIPCHAPFPTDLLSTTKSPAA